MYYACWWFLGMKSCVQKPVFNWQELFLKTSHAPKTIFVFHDTFTGTELTEKRIPQRQCPPVDDVAFDAFVGQLSLAVHMVPTRDINVHVFHLNDHFPHELGLTTPPLVVFLHLLWKVIFTDNWHRFLKCQISCLWPSNGVRSLTSASVLALSFIYPPWTPDGKGIASFMTFVQH